MLTLDIRQHQSARDPIEHVGRGGAAAALFKPSVPGRADIGALSYFFASEPLCPPLTRQWKAKSCGIEFRAAILQVGAEQIVVFVERTHAGSHYTCITSLLYQDK